MQTVINLDEVVQNPEPKFGELKLTVAQFFRVNGGTTQLRGVTPDINLPGTFNIKTTGESSFDNALPWSEVKPAKYKSYGDMAATISQLQEKHDNRVKSEPEFQRFVEDIVALKAQREKTTISLNETTRRDEISAETNRLKARGENKDEVNADKDDGLQSNERSLSAEIAIEKPVRAQKMFCKMKQRPSLVIWQIYKEKHRNSRYVTESWWSAIMYGFKGLFRYH